MSPEPLDGSVIVYDTQKNVYEPSEFTVDDLGTGGGSSNLTVVNGGTVTLDDATPEGTLVGYRTKGNVIFTSITGETTLEPGVYTFERVADGWQYYPVAVGTLLEFAPEVPDAPTLLTDTFTSSNGVLSGHVADSGQSWAGSTAAALLTNNRMGPNSAEVYITHGSTASSVAFDVILAAGEFIAVWGVGFCWLSGGLSLSCHPRWSDGTEQHRDHIQRFWRFQ